MIAATTLGLQSAHAGTTQATDSFNNPSSWTKWKSGGAVALNVGSSSGARTPSNMASILWAGGGTTSDWASIGKAFFWNGTAGGGDHPAFLSCTAGVYLRGTIAPVSGQIELINTITNTYVGIKTFSLPALSGWKQIVVTNSFACSPWLTFRIIVPNNTEVQGVAADDVTIRWNF